MACGCCRFLVILCCSQWDEERTLKRLIAVAAVLVALPGTMQVQYSRPGFYVGAEGG